ncbi:type VI secretion system tip protein TssI/VgrG [Pseudomonas sp. NPDC098747]|uniref:type VI secretion system tip protein TssI/VgrG n=1 Tax=Pseudomonas sp. NPDC098747 TaxID=3364487 RepID=UPI003839E207
MFTPANTAQFTLSIPNVRNDFKVLAFEGVEAISQLYAIRVELVNEDPDVDLEALLSKPAFLQFGLNGEGIHGRIEDVRVGESGRRLTHYQLSLVPVLHYLQFSYNQRIFQHLTVPQIIAQVLKGHGIQADVYTFNVSTSPVREYCTQYGESDFEYLQRLCAEDGIAWHHQHSATDHQLVFTDDQTWFPKLGGVPYQQDSGMVADQPVIKQFSQSFNTRTGKATRRDYDFKRPGLLLEGGVTADVQLVLEDYNYGRPMASLDRAKMLAKHALERHRHDYHVAEGQSDEAMLRSGHFFKLTDHPRKACNDLWLALGIRHTGKQPSALEESVTSNTKPEDGFTQGYRNSFTAIPWDVFYRPPLPSRKPILVSQTARVTGPVGEDIACDDFGRVKIEFHWDRAELNNDQSSRWVRVASNWAGEHFGSVTIPRVGMEVVVTFNEGDPDQPLITGCVPNTVTAMAYELPEHKTKTVLRSQSSPATGGYNELMIEDRAGQEKIYLRAERDLEQLVRNDSTATIGNDRREEVTRNSYRAIGGTEEQHTTGLRTTVLGNDDRTTVTGSSYTHTGVTHVIQAGDEVNIQSGVNVILDAGATLTLKGGGQHIVLNADGIFSSVLIEEGGEPWQGASAEHLELRAVEALIKQKLSKRSEYSG